MGYYIIIYSVRKKFSLHNDQQEALKQFERNGIYADQYMLLNNYRKQHHDRFHCIQESAIMSCMACSVLGGFATCCYSYKCLACTLPFCELCCCRTGMKHPLLYERHETPQNWYEYLTGCRDTPNIMVGLLKK